MKELIIGPSNGWLFGNEIFSLRQHGKFFKKAGATAMELCGSADIRRAESFLSNEDLGEFQHLSFHLPDYNNSQSLSEQALLVKKIVKKRKPEYCLIHPLFVPLEYFEYLQQDGDILVVIENMDKRKKAGFALIELDNLSTDFGLGFVLDVQHAYEHDPTMLYAWDLFQMMQKRLRYLHVSGETDQNNHALVHQSTNCKAIINFLGRVFSQIDAPIILEGEYISSDDVKKEIEFLKNKLL